MRRWQIDTQHTLFDHRLFRLERHRLVLAALLLCGLTLAGSCHRSEPSPREEGDGMPIEITEERPVNAPGTEELANEDRPAAHAHLP